MPFIKAAIGFSLILIGWLTIQRLWSHVLGAAPEQDALAGRLGCRSCDCHSPCKRNDAIIREHEHDSSREDTARTSLAGQATTLFPSNSSRRKHSTD